MNEILEYLLSNKKLNALLEDGRDINCVNEDSFAFFTMLKFLKNKKTTFVITSNLYECQNVYNKLSNYLNDSVYMYCVDEITKFTSLATSPEMLSSRVFILDKLASNEPIIVVTHTMALKRLVPNKSVFKSKCINLQNDLEINIKEFINNLVKLGYKNVYKVTQPFEFSSRGGVVDVFSINYQNPIRIEFFDTLIDSIRYFDIETQRTISTTNNITILPATEFLFDNLGEGISKIREELKIEKLKCDNNLLLEEAIEEDITHLLSYDFNESYYKYYAYFNNYSSILDYLENANIYILNKDKVLDNDFFVESEVNDNILKLFDEGRSLFNLYLFYPIDELLAKIPTANMFSTSIENKIIDLNFIKVDTFDFNYDLLYKQLIQLLSEDYMIYIGLESSIHFNNLKDYFDAKDISYNLVDITNKLKKGINLSTKDYHIGLDFVDYKLYVIGESEIFKKRFVLKINQFSRYKNAVTIDSVNDLSIGDYLVHEVYGIGIYKGINTLLNQGVHRDYLQIEYKGGDNLYVPLEQFKLVRKYVSKEGAAPKLNKIGGKEWENTKRRINERVNELAEKLVNLYSLRVEKEGFCFEKDDDLQIAFENDFGYELTSDQKIVLAEIKQDMESNKIMDRILVGDVGFGKTEIAFRAAFKAINSGKQVAMLCPTTLLSRQHYLTAIDRFKNYGIRIKTLSRLLTEKETSETLRELEEGKIDFIIGTHRLLSKDVVYKDLGLLIVDEEHKFGVEHKEKIKDLKKNIDVLTLSATPIPRTLQMALTGVRGFSSINTPISNRMPVQTYVIQKDDYTIKEIIERELARNGQVFYLNNKIEDLPRIAKKLQDQIKGAKIAIAHGKLSVDDMEDIMQRFINNEFNVLLCTTIIENGIDISNVNTIIVENADCFGLSQLYQIKGRVGRGDRLAYCYLMYKKNKEISEIAQKRLQTIKEFTALGSGYKVAMRDLITRGAGDLLGPEQSGFIDSVGIDMYIEMLHNAIENKKNNIEKPFSEEKPKYTKALAIDAYIPQEYFGNDYEKISLYKRIDKSSSLAELNELKEEMIDETGKLPSSINMLFEKKAIDIFASDGLISKYSEDNDYMSLFLSKDINKMNGIGLQLFNKANEISRSIILQFKGTYIEVKIKKKDDWLKIATQYLSEVNKLVKGSKKNGN